MLTVFCIRRSGEPAPSGLEVPGCGRVALLEQGALGAWLCEGRLEHGLEGVRVHDAVVRAALRSATPLPARFGTTFPDEGALRESLREREADLLSGLARIAGRVEMGVRVMWNEGIAAEREEGRFEVGEIGSGRAYLEARRAELESDRALRRRADAVLDQLSGEVVERGTPEVRMLLPEPGVAGTMAHLVHRHGVAAYRRRVEAARAVLPHLDLHVTGPWAPYSFA